MLRFYESIMYNNKQKSKKNKCNDKDVNLPKFLKKYKRMAYKMHVAYKFVIRKYNAGHTP